MTGVDNKPNGKSQLRFLRKRTLSRVFFSCLFWLLPISLPANEAIPLSYFFAFYQNLLEFSTSPPMTINGFVHCNSNIYVGSSATLTFNKTVSTAGTILAPPNNGGSWGDPTNYNSSWNTFFNGDPGFVNNSSVIDTSLGTANPRTLIELPPPEEDPGGVLGMARLYNQAQVVLTVTNSGSNGTNFGVTVKVQRSPAPGLVPGLDPAPVIVTYSNATHAFIRTNLPFLSLTNRFFDRREYTTNFTTQIDVGLYKAWLTNASGPVSEKFVPFGDTDFPTILYVADNRSTGPNRLAVVRLTNGISPPINGGLGFSVATPNPLYVLGNYNCTNPAYLGTTNTSSSTYCALYCDALTILSSGWSDSGSLQSFLPGYANSTTINAVIVAGLVPSTGSDMNHFSGGLHNFQRLLEDWSATTLNMNTAIINLYTSARATNTFVDPGAYYSPPIRKFVHDTRFQDPTVAPPGMPLALVGAPLIYTPAQTVVEPFGSNDVLLTVTAAGYGPLAYQWAVNSTNIDGATNSFLVLSNLQASESSAVYTVAASDGVSTNAATMLHLIVSNVPPLFTQQPVSQWILAGSNASFSATAVGKLPITWQWQFNQTNIDGATNATWVLTNATPDQAGDYSVLVTNANGFTTSSNATLSVYVSPSPSIASPAFSANNQMQFNVTGVPRLTYAVQVSTDLVNWDFVATNVAPFDFTDPSATNSLQRFYRAVYMP